MNDALANAGSMTTVEEALSALCVSEDDVREYFLRVEEVMHHVISEFGADKTWSEQYWCSGLNPFYNQLDLRRIVGLPLAIVEYYGAPHSLATPFGSITFTSANGDHHDWFERVKNDLGLKPLWGDGMSREKSGAEIRHSDLEGVFVDNNGVFGPVWEVTRALNGYAFAKAEFMPSHVGIPAMQHSNSFNYELVKEIWSRCAPSGFVAARERADQRFKASLEDADSSVSLGI